MYLNKFFIKLGIKNIVFPFITLGYLFYIFLFRNEVTLGLERLITYYTYPMIFGGAGFGILTTYYTGKSNEVIDYLYENKFKKFRLIVTSITVLSAMAFLIPLLFMLVVAFTKLKLDFYSIRVILHFSIIYFVFNLFFIMLGGLIGTTVKGYKKYIIFSVLSVFLTINMTDASPFSGSKSSFSNLANFGYDYVYILTNYQTSAIFNKEFWIDNLFPLMIVAVIVGFIYSLYAKRNKKVAMLVLASVVPLSIMLTVMYSNSYTDTLEMGLEEKISGNNQYFVDNYEMYIDLLGDFHNTALIDIYCNWNLSDDLEIELDNVIDINSINIGDKAVEYTRENDFIKVDREVIEKLLAEDSRNLLFKIEYSGEKQSTINFSEEEKAWYPRVNGYKKKFQLACRSNKPIKSNLNMVDEKYESNIYTTSFSSFDEEVYLIEESINTLGLPYETYGYDMDIDTTDYFKNTARIKVKNNALGKKDLVFSLYDNLDINYLKIDGKAVSYDREGSTVYIEKDILPDNDFVMEVEYSGEVNLRNDLSMLIAYAYERDISLVDEAIPWYPMLGDLEKDFYIKVKSKVDMFSNLEDKTFDGKDTYTFKSRDTGITLVGGNMTELKYEEYEFVLPKAFLYLNETERNVILEDITKIQYLKEGKVMLTSAYNENYRYKNTAILDFYQLNVGN